ncbi:MAG: hypothetical protein ACLSDJ_03900 [Butyricimonas faecihominis]
MPTVIASMENRQASLTASDLQEYPLSWSLQDTMSKDNYSRLAAIGKVIELTRQSGKKYIQSTFDKYRKLSLKNLTRNVKPDKIISNNS